MFANYQPKGVSPTTRAFFQRLGTNGRTSATFHAADAAYGLKVTDIEKAYNSNDPPGADPLFAAMDGADCENPLKSHISLLSQGLIRIMLPIAPKTFSGARLVTSSN